MPSQKVGTHDNFSVVFKRDISKYCQLTIALFWQSLVKFKVTTGIGYTN